MVRVPDIFETPEFFQIDLSDLVKELGENDTKNILSSFVCPKNKDVEDFLRNKALEFSRQELAKTNLVFWKCKDEIELVGYYSVCIKSISVDKNVLSNTQSKKLRANGFFDEKKNEYHIWATLIAQLGKNFANGNDSIISGKELLQLAVDKAKQIQKAAGGKFVYIECEESEKLIEFYTESNFKVFGRRRLDKDETNLSGTYLKQLFVLI